MLAKNKCENLITFNEVYNELSNDLKINLKELIDKTDYFNDKINILIKENGSNINYVISEFIKDDIGLCNKKIDESLVNLYNIHNVKDKEFIESYIKRVKEFEINNLEDFPFIYVLILLKEYCQNYVDLYIFVSDSNINYDIVKLIFSDLIVYNIYIDESGNLERDTDRFVVGGYFIKDISFKKWSKETKQLLSKLEGTNKFKGTSTTVYHRTSITNSNYKRKITKEIFDYIDENGGKFVCIFEDDISNIKFTKYYYIDLLSQLIVQTLNKLLIDNKDIIDLDKNKLLLIIHTASRVDKDNNIYDSYSYNNIVHFLNDIYQKNEDNQLNYSQILEKWKYNNKSYINNCNVISITDIESSINEHIEEWKIKYGLMNKNINHKVFDLGNAKKDTGLVFADYFCNTFYNTKPGDYDDLFENNLYIKNKYSSFDNNDIDFYIYKNDYYNIFNKYILYKKLYLSDKIESKSRIKKYSENYINKILDFLKKDNLKKSIYYIVTAVKDILDCLGHEANYHFKYEDMLFSQDVLIELFDKEITSDDKFVINTLKSIIFMINNAKLAIYNHIDDTKNALAMVNENNNILENNFINDYFFFKERILYLNLKMLTDWDFYNCDSTIKSAEKISKETLNYKELYNDEIARFYGTLGQTYIINYYVSDKEENLENAKKNFLLAIDLFKYDNNNIMREYNYLMLYAIVSNKDDEFVEYLCKYLHLNFNKDLEEIKSKYINYLELYIKGYTEQDKQYKYLIIRLLKYCYFSDSVDSENISSILIKNNEKFRNNIKTSLEDIDIEKDYALLYYKVKKEKIDLSVCHQYVEKLDGIFNDMRRLSLCLAEISMCNDEYLNKSLELLEKLSCIDNSKYKDLFRKYIIIDEYSQKKILDVNSLIKKLYM